MSPHVYYRRRNAGVCVVCEGPVVPNQTRCQTHREAERLNGEARRLKDPEMARRTWQRRRQKQSAAGLCWSCDQPAVAGQTMCERHRKDARDRSTRHAYKLTPEELADLRAATHCGLCGGAFDGTGWQPKAPIIDHNHQTGKVRSVLHQQCNVAIGMFKEDVGLLRAAIDYLTRHAEEV